MSFISAVLPALLLTACGGDDLHGASETRARLEQMRRSEYADLIRHKAECQAQAVEFPGDTEMLQACLETHRILADAASRQVEAIDKRLAELPPPASP